MKKKGFTLVELVVGMAVSSIVLAMLGTLLFFTVQSNNRIVKDQKHLQNALTIRNIINQHFDMYNDETLTIEEGTSYTSLFKTDTHNLYLEQNKIYFVKDGTTNMLFESIYDINIIVDDKKDDTIVYNINYDKDSNLKLIKGKI